MEKRIDPSILPWVFFESSEIFNRAQGQCDCACAEPVLRPTAAKVQADQVYRLYSGFQSVPLDPEFTVGLGRIRPLLMNAAALQLAKRFGEPHPLAKDGELMVAEKMVCSGLLVPADCDVLPPSDPETLTAWLHLTDRCNLRCEYCYRPHRPENMTLETGQAAIEAALRSAEQHVFSEIKLKYAGGEPLLQFELLMQLQTYATQRCRQLGIHLDGVILTNGTLLTPARLKQIADLGLRVIVSLDGLGPGQARQRAAIDGSPSTPAVLRGLKLARQAGVEVAVSVTLTFLNLEELVELVDWLAIHEIDFGLNFQRPTSDPFTRLPDPIKLAATLRRVYQRLAVHPERTGGVSLLDRASLLVPHSYPCAAGHSALVFDCSGRVAACPMMLDLPVTNLEALDPLGSLRQVTGDRFNPPVEDTPACRACGWRNRCAGGCPVIRRTSAHFDYCQVYQELFPELLKLEGLRLRNIAKGKQIGR